MTYFKVRFPVTQDILPTEIPTNAFLRLTVPPIKFLETPLEVKCEASTFLIGHNVYLYLRSKDGVQPLKGILTKIYSLSTSADCPHS